MRLHSLHEALKLLHVALSRQALKAGQLLPKHMI